MSATITAEMCAERFGAVLRKRFGFMRCADKWLARRTNSDVRAIQNYLYGKHAPPAAKLIELAAECQELADEINRLIAERRAARGVD